MGRTSLSTCLLNNHIVDVFNSINYKFCKISQIYNPNLEQDISGLLDSLILAIDNFDLDYANEAIDHLLRYPLKIEYISSLENIKYQLNIYNYDTSYETAKILKRYILKNQTP